MCADPDDLQSRVGPVRLVADVNPPPGPATPTDPAGRGREIVTEGRTVFNVHCSHCHAPNAENPDPRTDLRRLRRRYGEAMREVFYAAVTEGRPTKGMPPWKAALSEETITKILTFLESVQAAP
jgi:polar amino acid transport system substrate-binding protein